MGIRSTLAGLLVPPNPMPQPQSAAPDPVQRQDSVGMGSIVNSLTGYGGVNDKGVSGLPNLYRTGMSLAHLESLYKYNGYAARIVDQLADDSTRKGWVVKDDDGESDPLGDELTRLHVFSRYAEALRWARLYGGSGIMLVTDDGADPSAQLRLESLRSVKSLVVLDAHELSPREFESDPTSPLYRLPRSWYVHPTQLPKGDNPVVHASRMLYFFGRKLPPSQRWRTESRLDQSILDLSWDAIRNLTSIDQAGSSVAQQIMVGVLKMAGLGARQAGDQRATFIQRIELLAKTMSALNLMVLDPAEDYQTRGASLTGWADLSAQARLALAAVTGMPQTLLFGETPGGLSTDGDSHRKLWAQVVSSYQAFAVREQAVRLTEIIYAQRDGPTSGKAPESWTLEFRPLDEPTREELAAIEKTHAETDQIRINSGVVGPEHVARSRFGAAGYQDALLPVDDDELESAEEAEDDVREMQAQLEDAADTYAVPEAARNNARKVLRWRAEHPDEIEGMTDVGWARARQLATQPRVGLDTVKRMSAFNRHRENAEVSPKFKSEPWKDAGYVAWLGWGGTTGIDWARGISSSSEE